MKIIQPSEDELDRMLNLLVEDHVEEHRFGFLLGRRQFNNLYVEGISIPEQTGNSVTYSIRPGAYIETLRDIGADSKSAIGVAIYRPEESHLRQDLLNEGANNLGLILGLEYVACMSVCKPSSIPNECAFFAKEIHRK